MGYYHNLIPNHKNVLLVTISAIPENYSQESVAGGFLSRLGMRGDLQRKIISLIILKDTNGKETMKNTISMGEAELLPDW